MSASTSGSTSPPRYVEAAGRVGYVSRGVVYFLIAVMAALAAFDAGGGTHSSRSVLSEVLHQPGGWIALAFVAVGFTAYAAWRFFQLVWDPDDKGDDAWGLLLRIKKGGSGVIYLGLAGLAVALIFGLTSGSGGGGGGGMLDQLANKPWGRWVVGIFGLGVAGVGIGQAVNAVTLKFEDDMSLPDKYDSTVRWLSRVGLGARALAFMVSGGLFISMAIGFSEDAGGTGAALDTIQSAPWGDALLGVTAAGLACYGAYSVLRGVLREFD